VIIDPDRATRLLELAGGDVDRLIGPHVTQAAQEGDPLAVELLAELGRWVGEGAASATALLDPALIVVGGGVAAAGDLLLVPARRGFAEQLSARGHRPEAALVVASMGNDAGLVGAADLARV
jgi:glucokinase